MTTRFIPALCAAALLACGAALAGPHTLRTIEEAAESPTLDIDLTSSTEGRVVARLCDRCEQLTLRVNADTAVVHRGARVDLQVAKDRAAQGATVFFEPESLVVRRIVLWD
jgi:hypothetical protein